MEPLKETPSSVAFSINFWPTIEKTVQRIQKYYTLRSVLPAANIIFIDSVIALERSLRSYWDKRYMEEKQKLDQELISQTNEILNKYEDKDHESIITQFKAQSAEKKWEALMELMGRKNMIPTESAIYGGDD